MDKKQNQGRRDRRRVYKRRRRTGLYVFVALLVLTLGTVAYFSSTGGEEDTAVVERVADPNVGETPESVSEPAPDEEEAADEEASDNEEPPADEEVTGEEDDGEAAPPPPASTEMRLSVPALGVFDAIVTEGEVGLELGAQRVSGLPWEEGSNTYIAGHRIGFPGMGSDHIFYNLPFVGNGTEVILEDANGTVYTYAITEMFAVSPTDLWVLDSVPGREMISLQVCTETPSDWATIGPSLFGGGPESGRMIARADLVDTRTA